MVRSPARALIGFVAAIAALSAAAQAQVKPREERAAVPAVPDIPRSALPPEGMCRVWLSGVPERQQPAPTDCATAIRNRPRDSQVLFGDLRNKVVQPAGAKAATTGAAKSEARFRGVGNSATSRGAVAQRGANRGATTGAMRTTTVGASVTTRSGPDSAKPIRPEKPQ